MNRRNDRTRDLGQPKRDRPQARIHGRQVRGSSSVLVNFSMPTTVFKLAMITAVSILILRLSLGWSLRETARLAEYAFGTDYAMIGAWSIQLLPQVLLIWRALLDPKDDRGWRRILLFAALGVNLIDVLTNWAAWLSVDHTVTGGLSDELVFVGTLVGLAAGFAITWAEEALSFFIGIGLHMLALIVASRRGYAPSWMLVGGAYAKAASGIPVSPRSQRSAIPTSPSGRPNHRADNDISRRMSGVDYETLRRR